MGGKVGGEPSGAIRYGRIWEREHAAPKLPPADGPACPTRLRWPDRPSPPPSVALLEPLRRPSPGRAPSGWNEPIAGHVQSPPVTLLTQRASPHRDRAVATATERNRPTTERAINASDPEGEERILRHPRPTSESLHLRLLTPPLRVHRPPSGPQDAHTHTSIHPIVRPEQDLAPLPDASLAVRLPGASASPYPVSVQT